jgi:hypothetical protein
VKLNSIQFIEQWVILELYNEFLLEIFSSRVTPLNGTRLVLTFNMCIVEQNGQVSYNFLTIGLKGAQMLPLTQEQIILDVYSNVT